MSDDPINDLVSATAKAHDADFDSLAIYAALKAATEDLIDMPHEMTEECPDISGSPTDRPYVTPQKRAVPRVPRRFLAAAAAVALVATGAAGFAFSQGDDTPPTLDRGPSTTERDPAVEDRIVDDIGGGPYELPFGLEEVDGLTMIGRPAVSPSVDPAQGTVELTAAFRVDADDPAEAINAFVVQLEQSDDLRFGVLSAGNGSGVSRGDSWIVAGAARDSLVLQLWATEERPILLVSIVQRKGDGEATSDAGEFDAGDLPDSSLAWDERTDGDVLFAEQRTTIHLPEGSRALTPTVPVPCGTGGSFSVLSVEDGRAAVEALLAEAQASETYAETDGPDERDVAGVTVVTADFVVPAGGWSLDVVSVRGPEDEWATVYVTSCAD